jgi:hypothetical protein
MSGAYCKTSRERNPGDIAGQRNADASERRAEKIKLAEHSKTAQHSQPNNEQERRLKEEFAVSQREKTENQANRISPMLWLALKPTQHCHRLERDIADFISA